MLHDLRGGFRGRVRVLGVWIQMEFGCRSFKHWFKCDVWRRTIKTHDHPEYSFNYPKLQPSYRITYPLELQLLHFYSTQVNMNGKSTNGSAPNIPTTQWAQVVEKVGGPAVYKQIPVAKPGPDEVLINVKYTGVCHTGKS